jgi:hypothetical protein
MRRILFALAIVCLFVNNAAALDGSGTQEDPWRIKSLDDFNDFAADANYWAGYTRLETDVNLAGLTYTTAVIAPDTGGIGIFQGTAFTGVFDGNDRIIHNAEVYMPFSKYAGLFGYVDSTGRIHNLDLEGVTITGETHAGGMAGVNEGSITDCSTSGSVEGTEEGDNIGGLVGSNLGSTTDCYSTCSVNGNSECDNMGGLVGANSGSVTDCYASGPIDGSDCYRVGGLVGLNSEGIVLNCYSTGAVSGTNWGIGGLVGWNGNDGSISNCYSSGDVSGIFSVGGLMGFNSGSVLNCFWDTDTQTHGVTESIGDNLGTATNVAGLPTTQSQTKSTFTDAGWDFIEIWNIGENQTYPYLRVHPAGDINHDDIINMLDFAIFANHWLEGMCAK